MSTQVRKPPAIDWLSSAKDALDDVEIEFKLKESSKQLLGTYAMEPFFYHVLQEEVYEIKDAKTIMLVHSNYTTIALNAAGKVSTDDPFKRLQTISYDNERRVWVHKFVNAGVDGCGGKILFLPFSLNNHWVLVVLRLQSDNDIFSAYLYDSLPKHYTKKDLDTLTIATTLIVERILGRTYSKYACVHLIRKSSPLQNYGSNNCAIHVLQTFRILATRAKKIGQPIDDVSASLKKVTRSSLLHLIKEGAKKFRNKNTIHGRTPAAFY